MQDTPMQSNRQCQLQLLSVVNLDYLLRFVWFRQVYAYKIHRTTKQWIGFSLQWQPEPSEAVQHKRLYQARLRVAGLG